MVVRRDIVRAARRGAAVRRRQLAPAVGKGEKRRLPHTPFRSAGLSELTPGHDRSESRETVDRK